MGNLDPKEVPILQSIASRWLHPGMPEGFKTGQTVFDPAQNVGGVIDSQVAPLGGGAPVLLFKNESGIHAAPANELKVV